MADARFEDGDERPLNLFAQDAVNYQLPPKDIMELALAKPTPAKLKSSDPGACATNT